MANVCPQCGAPIDPTATECKFCGEKLAVAQAAQPQVVVQPGQPQPQVVYVQQPVSNDGINPNWPVKSKIAAGVLAILLGDFGIHKFYLGKPGQGILYLLLFWTYIPAILGFFEGIIYLCTSDKAFQLKYHVRIVD